MSKFSAYLALIRPVNCLMMGIAVIVGAALARPQDLSTLVPNLMGGFITGFTLTAASMTLNDYYDREIDAVNDPGRPLPSGSVGPREVVAITLILTFFGLAASIAINILSFMIALIALAISIVYNTFGKKTGLPGNFLVSMCVATPFVYGSGITTNTVELKTLIFASMAFLSNTGREITKGIVDIHGDRRQEVKTLAVLYGEKAAAAVAATFYLLSVFLSPLPWILNLVSFAFIPLVAITDLGLIAASIFLLRDCSREKARTIKNVVLLLFVIGLTAFFAGTLA